MREGAYWIRMIDENGLAPNDWVLADYYVHPDDGPLWWVPSLRRHLSPVQKIGQIEVGPFLPKPGDDYTPERTPVPAEIVWTTKRMNNDQPVWEFSYGDYHGRVNVGFDDSGWSYVVNNSGKMHFQTADEAKAAAEALVRERIANRLSEAALARGLYGYAKETPDDGPGDDWDLETEMFQLANGDGLPEETYRLGIRKLWKAYCALEHLPAPRLSVTPDVLAKARAAFDAHPASPYGAALLSAVSAALHAKASAKLPVHDEVEAYPLDAYLWKRASTDEWVLELSGSINDTGFHIRHAQPGDLPPEEALGLPTLHDLTMSVEELAEFIDVPSDMKDVVYFPEDNVADNEIYGQSAAAIRTVLGALDRARPRPVIID